MSAVTAPPAAQRSSSSAKALRRFGRPVSSSVSAWRRVSASATFSRNAIAARTPMRAIAAVSRAMAAVVRVPATSTTSRPITTRKRAVGTTMAGQPSSVRRRGRCVGRSAAATRQAAPMVNSIASGPVVACGRGAVGRSEREHGVGERRERDAERDPPPRAARTAAVQHRDADHERQQDDVRGREGDEHGRGRRGASGLQQRREDPVRAHRPEQEDADGAVEPGGARDPAQAGACEEEERDVLADVEAHEAEVGRRRERHLLAGRRGDRRDELTGGPRGEADAEREPGRPVLAQAHRPPHDEDHRAQQQQELDRLVDVDPDQCGARRPAHAEHDEVHGDDRGERGPRAAKGEGQAGVREHHLRHRRPAGVSQGRLDGLTTVQAPGRSTQLTRCGRAPVRSR